MWCTSCGKEIPTGAKFCGNCGKPAGAPQPAAKPAAAQPAGAVSKDLIQAAVRLATLGTPVVKLINQAIAEITQQKFDQAVVTFQKAVKENPNSADAWAWLAWGRFTRTMRGAKTVEEFTEKLARGEIPVQDLAAENEEARKCFEKAQQLDPNNAAVLMCANGPFKQN